MLYDENFTTNIWFLAAVIQIDDFSSLIFWYDWIFIKDIWCFDTEMIRNDSYFFIQIEY